MLRDSGGLAWRVETGYAGRVVRALDCRRLTAVTLVTLLLSLGPLFSSEILAFFSPVEIVQAWFEHFAELAVAAVLTLAYTLLDEAPQRHVDGRPTARGGASLR